jgi:hypothetical protein
MYSISPTILVTLYPREVELVTEGQAVLRSYDSAPHPPPSPPLPSASCLSPQTCCVMCRLSSSLTGGGARSQILRPQESLALYKSFNTVLSAVYPIKLTEHKGVGAAEWNKRRGYAAAEHAERVQARRGHPGPVAEPAHNHLTQRVQDPWAKTTFD